MFGKIVALLDGSTLAQSVLPHTRALAHAFQAEVTLLRVLEQERKTDTGRLDPINWHLRKIAAQSFLDEVSKETADDQIWPNRAAGRSRRQPDYGVHRRSQS